MELPIPLDSSTGVPLHRQLYEAVRQAILAGRLPPQQRMPSTRELAKSLGISRSTVTQSYEQLLSEGYLEAIVGSGTYVCARLPEELLHAPPVEPDRPAAAASLRLSKYGRGLLDLQASEAWSEPDAPIDFRYGRPALKLFPLGLWRQLLSRHCRSDWNWLDYADDPRGYAPLRQAIAEHLSRYRAVHCQPEQVLITNGTQQALDLITRVLVDPGEAIALEDPGYLRARLTFLSAGATLVPVPVDESGLVVGELLTNRSIRLVYVTPSHQFPTGVVLSLPRRLELLAWAQQQEALIIEDDYDSEFRYGNRPIPALQGLAAGDAVLYVGTFSKVLFPSLRIGYIVLPPRLVSVFADAKRLSDRHLPILEQRVLTDFMVEGHLERHIRRMRTHYDQQRQALVAALKTHLGTQVTVFDYNAGIHLVAKLHTNLSETEMIRRAAQMGVGMVSTQPYYLKPRCSREFIFSYSELSEQQIQEGICRLARILIENKK